MCHIYKVVSHNQKFFSGYDTSVQDIVRRGLSIYGSTTASKQGLGTGLCYTAVCFKCVLFTEVVLLWLCCKCRWIFIQVHNL